MTEANLQIHSSSSSPDLPALIMKKSLHLFPTTLLYILLLLLLSSPLLTKSDDLIEEVCNKTPFYDLCLSSLEQTTSSAADIRGIASVMANLVLSNATETLNCIEELIKEATDSQTERALANCAELYIPVVKYNLPQAIDALRRNRLGFATYAISDASKQADTCRKYLPGPDQSSLSDRNNLVKDLCDVTVSIIRILLNP